MNPIWLWHLWLWAIAHDACPCRLGPLGSRLCGWLDAVAWRTIWKEPITP